MSCEIENYCVYALGGKKHSCAVHMVDFFCLKDAERACCDYQKLLYEAGSDSDEERELLLSEIGMTDVLFCIVGMDCKKSDIKMIRLYGTDITSLTTARCKTGKY